MAAEKQGWLGWVERVGNRLPDPAALFVLALFATRIASAALAPIAWDVVDPRSNEPLVINSLLTREALLASLIGMVKTFTSFHPLGVVLVTMLGVGVAEHAGLVRAAVRRLLERTPARLLTPALILVAIVSS